MIYMGDEYGHTKGGNNNTYCHDNYVIPLSSRIFQCTSTILLTLLTYLHPFCSLITSDGIKGRNHHQTSSDFAAL